MFALLLDIQVTLTQEDLTYRQLHSVLTQDMLVHFVEWSVLQLEVIISSKEQTQVCSEQNRVDNLHKHSPTMCRLVF
jgi:hypothetical protein